MDGFVRVVNACGSIDQMGEFFLPEGGSIILSSTSCFSSL